MSTKKKIVVIGPESTGKSTLSKALAEELGTVWVPEYARGYLEELNRDYTEEDLIVIAKGQLKLEDELYEQASGFLICDTDLYVIKVWSEAKYGKCDKWILEEIAEHKCDLYLLTDIDMPWEDDPLREHPNPEERLYFFNIYKDIVASSCIPFEIVSGNPLERLKSSLDAIKKHIY